MDGHGERACGRRHCLFFRPARAPRTRVPSPCPVRAYHFTHTAPLAAPRTACRCPFTHPMLWYACICTCTHCAPRDTGHLLVTILVSSVAGTAFQYRGRRGGSDILCAPVMNLQALFRPSFYPPLPVPHCHCRGGTITLYERQPAPPGAGLL